MERSSLEKLTVFQLVRQSLINPEVHFQLLQQPPLRPILSHHISLRTFLFNASRLRLGLPSGIFCQISRLIVCTNFSRPANILHTLNISMPWTKQNIHVLYYIGTALHWFLKHSVSYVYRTI
jgi:hypothetical protein